MSYEQPYWTRGLWLSRTDSEAAPTCAERGVFALHPISRTRQSGPGARKIHSYVRLLIKQSTRLSATSHRYLRS